MLGKKNFILILFFSKFILAAPSAGSSVPTYKISVDAQLTSHFIDHGLSMSDRNPAMNASFLFNLGPQFKFGFWGSNISNISSTDDNFWFKFLAEIKTDFNQNSALRLYLTDDHYYKSAVRNGQIIGIKYNYQLYSGQAEWSNNFEATHTDYMYLNFGKLFETWKGTKSGGRIGYTFQHSTNLSNYFDIRALTSYKVTPNFDTEAGITLATNASQFGSRADPGFYVSIALSY